MGIIKGIQTLRHALEHENISAPVEIVMKSHQDAQRRQADALERLAREAQQARSTAGANLCATPRRSRCRAAFCR